jgi:hypothetical protein
MPEKRHAKTRPPNPSLALSFPTSHPPSTNLFSFPDDHVDLDVTSAPEAVLSQPDLKSSTWLPEATAKSDEAALSLRGLSHIPHPSCIRNQILHPPRGVDATSGSSSLRCALPLSSKHLIS